MLMQRPWSVLVHAAYAVQHNAHNLRNPKHGSHIVCREILAHLGALSKLGALLDPYLPTLVVQTDEHAALLGRVP